MVIIEEDTNYPTALMPKNIPFEKRWPTGSILSNVPSIIANGHDRQFLPQMAGRLRTRVLSFRRPMILARLRGQVAIDPLGSSYEFGRTSDYNIPNPYGPQNWPPGTTNAPSVMSIVEGPEHTMHGQEYTGRMGYSMSVVVDGQ